MDKKKIIICKRCVMDSTDPTIKFDENGYCNYCNYALATKERRWLNTEIGRNKLDQMTEKIQNQNKSNKYDCIVGLSGGVDSSYLAYICKKNYGLRMLALHIDSGWNSEVAKSNIKKLCEKMDIDLIVEKLNQEEFMDLQRAYFLAGVPSQDNPQDHMFIASLYKYAKANKIKYLLSGANFSTECILQKGYSYNAADKVNLLDIHKKYGSVKLKALPTISLFDRYIKYRYINKVIMVRPLDYMDYNLNNAIKELERDIGFDYYGGKHYESIFTKFYQQYYLPFKYNYDKRKSHLSSLIVTQQMTREEALEQLKEPLYDPKQMEMDIEYIIRRIGITKEEFYKVMNAPLVSNYEFRTSKWNKFYGTAVKARRFLEG